MNEKKCNTVQYTNEIDQSAASIRVEQMIMYFIISTHKKYGAQKLCHIDKFWVVISMVPKTTSLRLSRRVSVAKLVKRSSSTTKQYMSVLNYFYFFPQKNAKKDTIKITDPKVQYWILQS